MLAHHISFVHFHDVMANGKNIRKLASRVSGRTKAARMAISSALKRGEAKASKGIVPALVIGGATQTVGLALANAGKLSIVVGKYRIPVFGLGAALVSFTVGYMLRKRPVSKILYAVGTSSAISQVVDLVKFGFMVKPDDTKKADSGVKVNVQTKGANDAPPIDEANDE